MKKKRKQYKPRENELILVQNIPTETLEELIDKFKIIDKKPYFDLIIEIVKYDKF
jgi:hypothetical protein